MNRDEEILMVPGKRRVLSIDETSETNTNVQILVQ